MDEGAKHPAPDDKVWASVYGELKQLAAGYLKPGSPATLQPTALVNEAFVRMKDRAEARDREHFLAIAATAMRQIIVDYARRRGARKRGGDWERVTLNAVLDDLAAKAVDAIELDQAMTKLAELSERQARVVELRVFGGLGVAEAAGVLGVSNTTVKNEWRFATAWLKLELGAAG